MRIFRQGIHGLLVISLMAWTVPALAQWELDSERSTLNFVSIKNNSIGETHLFSSMVGFVGDDGRVQLAIDLDSVETMIPIRNERMRELLFQTAMFPTANVTAQVAPEVLAAITGGGSVTTDIAVTLALHGAEREITVPVLVSGDEGGLIRVMTPKPVIVGAADFGLEDGVTALREIAGLNSISTAVPVTLNLVFTPAN
ncbi:MAG: YceI family protein [Halioglobus sp.]